METSVIKKKLSKFSTSQLLVKVEKNSLTKEEMSVALEIIESRTGSAQPEETAEEAMIAKGELDIEDIQEETTEGIISSEEVSEAIDKVYALENSEASKGLMALFAEPVDDYSDLSQERRKEIVDYCNKVVSGVSPKDVKPEKKSKKGEKAPKSEKPAKKTDGNPFEFYGFNPNDYSEFKTNDKGFFLGVEGAEDLDVSKFSGAEAITLLGGKLKKGDKITVTTAKGKAVIGEFCRIKFSSKPYVFSVYVTDETGEKVGFRLGGVKSIAFAE